MTKKSRLGPRQLHSLAALPHEQMLDELAIGLPIIARSASQLSETANALPGEHARARDILALQAEEEAAKALMLMDMVRCPPGRTEDLTRLGRQLSDHLARLIYAEACDWRPADFAEVRRAVAGQRREFYLDGPETGEEFIMRNNLIRQREELLYADRVLWEEGYEWNDPGRPRGLEMFEPRTPATRLVAALAAVNAFDRQGLGIIHAVWGSWEINNATRWSEHEARIGETLEAFEKKGWLKDVPDEVGPPLREWPMPMYELDCRMIRVDPDELAARRRTDYDLT